MKNLKPIIASLAAVVLVGVSLPSVARPNVDFYVNVAPPPLRYEVVPGPRVGWVWAPGYWDWRGNRYFWVPGHHIRHRPGYYYEPARWVPRGDRYYYARPGWRHDRDGDGVPDRFDRAPNNPYYR